MEKTYKKCIFILLDGSRPDVIGRLLDEGRMPNFFKCFVSKGTFTRATTVFPSTTGPAYLPFLTGFYPGTCNVPGIRWFDRERFSNRKVVDLHAYRSYVGIESYFFNRDISKNVQTLFEKFPGSSNIFNPVSRGVSFFKNHGNWIKALYALYAHYTDDWETVDQKLVQLAQKSLHQKSDFLFLALPAVDELSHHTHPFSEKVIDAYIHFDQALGKILETLEKQKILDDTLFVCAGDHGLSATHTHFDLVGFIQSLGYETFYYPKIFKRKFDVAVMQSGNAMAHIYVQNGKGWRERSSVEGLEKLVDQLSKRKEIAWVAGVDKNQKIYIRNHEGEAWIHCEGEKILYQTKGKDPFLFEKLPNQLTSQESLDKTFFQAHPDALVQLLQIFKSPRAGDLIVSGNPGFDLRLAHEWPEHKASHGSLHIDHMHVPLAISHPIELHRKIRSVDVFPTILKLMGIDIENVNCEGLSLVA
ncbi:MAG: hypothetical protein A3B70_02390 [Deltaproteobacteria bacterium RIFCSPHIGHO2_02_FULL_40_11]|nr:MAG: hypothetical protein A3B70_02390 [Deltaproteobacteria bacterium RIFCSPHIGHO2_02_FULL_40_11]